MKMLFCFLLCCFQAVSQTTYSDSIKALRREHELTFRNGLLNEEELKVFEGICYFEIDTNYIVRAELIRESGKKFPMPMTKQRDKEVYYRKWGYVRFVINDSVCRLNVYENLDLKGNRAYKNYLFLPFRDLTSGTESYGGGRFIDLQKNASGFISIDFNTAYHPYCLYSKRYSCPIPPAENTLSVSIRAGECYLGAAH